MSTEKFSPQLLKSILEAEGIDTSGLRNHVANGSAKPSSTTKLSPIERRRTLKVLATLIAQFRAGSEQLLSFPLQDLHDVLRLLAELAIEAKQKATNREEKKKVLHVAAAMLRRMLHTSDATHYRVLGLQNGADSRQIEEHHRLLHELFWFDDAIDPQRKSRLRISEAYAVLKDPQSRSRYDEDLAQMERQLLRSLAGGRGRKIWWGVVALTLVAVGSVLFLYFGSGREAERENRAETEIPNESPVKEAGVEERLAPDSARSASGLQDSRLSEQITALEQDGVVKEPEPKTAVNARTRAEVEQESTTGQQGERLGREEVAEGDDSVGSATLARKEELLIKSASSRRESKAGSSAEKGRIRRYSISREKVAAPVLQERPVRKQKIHREQKVSAEEEPLFVTSYPEESLVVPPQIVVPQVEPYQQQGRKPEPVIQHDLAQNTSKTGVITPTMVVIGSPGLPLNTLSRKQVKAIFLSQDPRLPTGERVTIIAAHEEGSAKSKFYREILGKSPRQLKIHWAKIRFQGRHQPLEEVEDEEMVKEKVARSTSAIGIIKSSSVDGSVKVLFTPDGHYRE